jgi:hypothetical protein
MNKVLKTKPYFSREELTDIHNRNKNNALETFEANKKSAKKEDFDKYFANLSDSLETTFKLTYDENERKRESTVKEAIEKCRCFYVENVSQELNQVCVESEKFDELSNGLKQMTFKQFNDFCAEDKNLFKTNFSKVSVRKKFNLN